MTAEGIETPRHHTLLRHLNCDIGQGYHLGRPATATAFTQQLHGEDLS